MPINYRKLIITTLLLVMMGTLLHFVYDFSNHSPVVGIIAPVNESVWEHLKLLFWPFIIFSFVDYFINKNHLGNSFTITLICVAMGMLLIVFLFYTYTGIIGKNFLIIDILIFVIALTASNYLYFKMMNDSSLQNDKINMISLILLISLMLIFVFFTFDPPQIPLFMDPLTSRYGIK